MTAASSPFSLALYPSFSSPRASSSSSVPFSVFSLSGKLPRGVSGNWHRLHAILNGASVDRSSGGTAKKKQKSGADFRQETSRWSVKVPSRRTQFPWQEMVTELANSSPPSPNSVEPMNSSTRKANRRDTADSKTESLVPAAPILRVKDPDGDDYPDFLSILSGRRELPESSFQVDDEVISRLDDIDIDKKVDKSMISSILDTLNTSRSMENCELNSSLDGYEIDSVSMAGDSVNGGGKRWSRNRNTLFAEKTIPEPELKRLRNLALKMKERTKVGPSGVNEELVGIIHKKWKEAEVVGLKFEGPPALDMKKIHDTLEVSFFSR